MTLTSYNDGDRKENNMPYTTQDIINYLNDDYMKMLDETFLETAADSLIFGTLEPETYNCEESRENFTKFFEKLTDLILPEIEKIVPNNRLHAIAYKVLKVYDNYDKWSCKFILDGKAIDYLTVADLIECIE